jgi:HD-GYP domain-containing protein (c-di-GMP phosphodiesterase class II)
LSIVRHKNKLNELITLDSELNRIRDQDILLERILLSARRMLDADAGTIYIKTDQGLQFAYTQNDTLAANLPPDQKPIYSVMTVPITRRTISGYVASTKQLVNIKDVYKIPNGSPFNYDTLYDASSGYRTQSMLTVPLVASTGQLFGVIQIINKKNAKGIVIPFSKTDEDVAVHFATNVVITLERARMTRAIMLRMIQMAELRDPKETGAHVNRVAGYSMEIYERWAKSHRLPPLRIDREKDTVRMAAMLHDVGKVAVSDLILKKPGSFTPEERDLMMLHTVHGARLFLHEPSLLDKMAYDVALNHHENWDGTGYPGHIDVLSSRVLKAGPDGKPLGKKGYEIPLVARIVSLADVYDALRNRRVYKPAWTEDDTLAEIKKMSGTKFDPELVEVFFKVLPSLKAISDRYEDNS